MSRSRRHSPFMTVCVCDSEKQYKRQAHQAERCRVRVLLRQEAELLPHPKQYGNPWCGPKDGRQFIEDEKWMRK